LHVISEYINSGTVYNNLKLDHNENEPLQHVIQSVGYELLLGEAL